MDFGYFLFSKQINTLFANILSDMVQLFGDWFGDIAAIFVAFVIYLYLRINTKEKKTWNRLDLSFSVVIFVISAFEIIGAWIFENPFYGPSEGFIISMAIMAITAVTGTLSAIELRAAHKE